MSEGITDKKLTKSQTPFPIERKVVLDCIQYQ